MDRPSEFHCLCGRVTVAANFWVAHSQMVGLAYFAHCPCGREAEYSDRHVDEPTASEKRRGVLWGWK